MRHIAKDLTEKQLAGVGKVSFAFNYAEYAVDRVFSEALSVPTELRSDLTAWITASEGKIEIIKAAAISLKFPQNIQTALNQTLGDGPGFKGLKRYRNLVIHSRIMDAKRGIGTLVEYKGEKTDILITEDALEILYDKLNFLSFEISSYFIVFRASRLMKSHRGGSADRKRYEGHLQEQFSKVQHYQRLRLSPPQLPEFPEIPQELQDPEHPPISCAEPNPG